MSSEVSRRARARAKEAHERAKEAGARAAELAARSSVASVDEIATEEAQDQAVHRSQEALDRATFLAKEGYRHAAEAQRGAARAHDAVAETLELRAARGADDEDALRASAARHRSDAERHREEATVDDRRHAELEAQGPSADGAPNAGDGDEA